MPVQDWKTALDQFIILSETGGLSDMSRGHLHEIQYTLWVAGRWDQ